MKTRNFLLGAMGLLLMASCAKDDVASVNRDGDEITFNVVTNASTRVKPDQGVYCNNNMPDKFYVWATYDSKTYIENDEIVRRGSADQAAIWANNSGTRYWPEGNVKFFAHANADDEFVWNEGAPQIVNFTVPTAVAEQKDLIYAVKTASKTDGVVSFNFRHALSQVVFRASNPNKNLHVRISGVSICKLGNSNTFHYPTGNTDNNIVSHGGEDVPGTDANVWGTWDELAGGSTKYSVTFDPVDVYGGREEAESLTDKNEEGKEYSNNALLLLPQKTTAWKIYNDNMLEHAQDEILGDGEVEDVVNDPIIGTPENQEGTYFLIKCRIWNVAGEAFNEDTDICLWGKDGADDVAVPVALDLEQGKKYIYTFIFNGGGYDPTPGPDEPTPIFKSILFNATVDDFEPVQKETELQGTVLQLLG